MIHNMLGVPGKRLMGYPENLMSIRTLSLIDND
jgi:hypothetical protein